MEITGADGSEELSGLATEQIAPEGSTRRSPVKAYLKADTLAAAKTAAAAGAGADVTLTAAAAVNAVNAFKFGDGSTVKAVTESAANTPNDVLDTGEDLHSDVGCMSSSMCLFVGQEVRIHLVDLVRTRLTCIPPSSVGSMNSFFREMYTREIEQDAALAELYVHHSSSRKNTSLRPSRRIRGIITAFYTNEENPTDNVLRGDSVCGLEICFRVGVSVHLSPPSGSVGSISSSHEFAVYRRWNVRDFLSLRRVYSRNYSVDVFVEKRTAREGARRQVLCSSQFFLSLRPGLFCSQDSLGQDDPFLLNGSPLPPPAAAAETQSLEPASADIASNNAAAPQRRRGRPRKFPRPEETGVAAAEGLSLQQQQQQLLQRTTPGGGAHEGPRCTTVQKFGVKFYISRDAQESSETDENEEETGGDTPDTEQNNNTTLTRAKANARRAKRKKGRKQKKSFIS